MNLNLYKSSGFFSITGWYSCTVDIYVDVEHIVILGLHWASQCYSSCAEHLRYCSICHWLLNVPQGPPFAAHSVAKDDVVISTKGWVCIPLPEDIICALPCRQPEKGESDGSGGVGNSSFWHHINSALLIAPICCWARRLPEWLYSHSLDTQLVSHTHSLC